MKWCMSSRSAGQRNNSECCFSIISRRSAVYRPVGSKGGGWVLRVGIFSRGSPVMLRTMRNCSGVLVLIGRIFFATGLYFFLAAKVEIGGILVEGVVDTLWGDGELGLAVEEAN